MKLRIGLGRCQQHARSAGQATRNRRLRQVTRKMDLTQDETRRGHPGARGDEDVLDVGHLVDRRCA